MWILQIVFHLGLLGDIEGGLVDESMPADALLTEHVRAAIYKLDHPDFQQREAADAELFAMGHDAVYPLTFAAEEGPPEVSVRAFDLLQKLYRGKDEPTNEAVELVFEKLERSGNIAVAARALRYLENDSEIRQQRAITQFERLGGVVNYVDPNSGLPPTNISNIEYFMLGREWVGGEAGLRLLGRIEDIRNSKIHLYVIRGVTLSDESIQNLRAELPFIEIQKRGPARLGVRHQTSPFEEDGCLISEVEPDSAAERAGLRKNDAIIEIDGHYISNFEKLIQIIEAKEPGDKVPIRFRRGRETQEVTAELLPWAKQRRASNIAPKPQ